jgi:hypothetical protein
MIERREQLRFPPEPGGAFGIGREAAGRTFSATSRLSLVSWAR